MRSLYCSFLVLAAAVALGMGGDASPLAGSARQQAAPADPAAFKVFVKGAQVGTEEVSVTRTPAGVVISGSGSLSAPIDVITNRAEVRYDAQWKPIEANLDAIVHGQYTLMRTVFADGNATTQITQAGQQASRTAKASADSVVLLNSFFGFYEALAGRLATLQPGGQLRAFLPPQQEAIVELKAVTEERIQIPARTIVTRRHTLSFDAPGVPLQVELWTDEHQRLVRVSVPAQSFDVLRSDIATVSARRETVSRPGDEQVKIPANGFTLAATVSKPVEKPDPKMRYPAVVLVGGSGPTDRDEFVFNIPIFAQVAGALADAGFLVVRYDKRGVGQSGGRADSAGIEDYADDVRSVVKYLRSRKDVDRKRVAIAGHSEGGWVGMATAARNKDVAALVLIATPGVPGAEVVLAQQRHMLEGMKVPDAERQAKVDLQKKIQSAVLTGSGWEKIPANLRRQADTTWFRSFLAFDPAKLMPRVRQPILIVQGELDKQVFVPQAERLAELARSRKAPLDKQVALVRVPAVNHLLVPATTGEYEEYGRLPDKNVSKDVLSAIAGWLKQNLPTGR